MGSERPKAELHPVGEISYRIGRKTGKIVRTSADASVDVAEARMKQTPAAAWIEKARVIWREVPLPSEKALLVCTLIFPVLLFALFVSLVALLQAGLM